MFISRTVLIHTKILIAVRLRIFFFFFFNDTATTEIYTLSLHDALPIFEAQLPGVANEATDQLRQFLDGQLRAAGEIDRLGADRKSTRLNSSHSQISYAVFCLKKKKSTNNTTHITKIDTQRTWCTITRYQ